MKIRDMNLGEGMPKICVPITGRTGQEIIEEARAITGGVPQMAENRADMIEWRVDWFEDALNRDRVLSVLLKLREVLGNMPLLFTFRTREEGGENGADTAFYVDLLLQAAKSGAADLIDVELFTVEDAAGLTEKIHGYGVRVMLSSHDFHKTPPVDEMVERLCRMQDAGADIAKIAVMPETKMDVLALMEAALKMAEHFNKCPIAAMSMSEKGLISRLTGEFTGSVLTFGAAKRASAPGQMEAGALRGVLEAIHEGSLLSLV